MFGCLRLCLFNPKRADYLVFCSANANINVNVDIFRFD